MRSLRVLLVLLNRLLELILLIVDILPSRTGWCPLWGCKVGARVAGQTLRLKLPLHLNAHFLAGLLHQDGLVNQLLEVLKCVHHQLIFDWSIQSQSEVILLTLIHYHICGGVARKLDELVSILTH